MIPFPQQPKLVKKAENIGHFEIEALYPGYGVTVGNALRRVLLSSLEGAAITQIKIKNVHHEFTTMDFVKEDVIQIVLNLKKLRFKLHTEEPQRISLHVTGEKEVKGKNFELSPDVEIITKDLHIATLTDKKADFEVEALIEKGLGYVPVEARTKEKAEVGIIFLDALFSPMEKVSFHVEHMRVGDRTDYDRLYIEIETDGTIEPEEALRYASNILKLHFELVEEAFTKSAKTSIKEKGETTDTDQETATEERGKEEEDLTKMNIEDLNLSTRTINVLLNSKIKTVGGLLRKSEASLLELEGMGDTGVEEIKKAFKKLGVEPKE